MSQNRQQANSRLNDLEAGVVHGFIVRDPGSATLTATIEGGEVRIQSATPGVGLVTYVLAETTKAFTASKDTYYYISGTDGTRGYYEAANAGAKPVIGTDIPANSVFIAKVVTDGSRITAGAVTDLRSHSGADLVVLSFGTLSFVTANQGATYVTAPFNGQIKCVYGTVSAPLGATDTGTITAAIGINDVYTDVTNGVATFAISAAIGARATTDGYASAARTFRQGQMIRLTSLKTTTGGTVNTFVLVERMA